MGFRQRPSWHIDAARGAVHPITVIQESAPPPPSLNVKQVNVGDVGALDLARRLAFILASAGAREAAPVVIEGEKAEPTDNSELVVPLQVARKKGWVGIAGTKR